MISQFNGAVFDHTRSYRFLLWRFWTDAPRVLFIGLNPSTANELTDDPTVKRLCGFAQRWGYGGLYVCNLYSYITPHPMELMPDTRHHRSSTPAIQMAKGLSVLTVCGWGDGIITIPEPDKRAQAVLEMLDAPMCFGFTQAGNPKHPLYLPSDAELKEWDDG